MLNINEGRYMLMYIINFDLFHFSCDFHLTEDDDNNQYVLDVACPR